MDHGKTYDVNGHGFDSFTKAIAFAKPIRADVVEVASDIRRWTPAVGVTCSCTRTARRKNSHASGGRHVLVHADGSTEEFSRVRR